MHSSQIVRRLLDKLTPAERFQSSTKMMLAARLGDLILERKLSKEEFAVKMNKSPIEIAQWLSGTYNFTLDTLPEIAVVLEIAVAELLAA